MKSLIHGLFFMSERFRAQSEEEMKRDSVEAALDEALSVTGKRSRESGFLDRIGRRFPKIAGIITALGIMGSGAPERAEASPAIAVSKEKTENRAMNFDSEKEVDGEEARRELARQKHFVDLLKMNQAPKFSKDVLYGGVSVAVHEAFAQKYAQDKGEKDARSTVAGRLIDILGKPVVFQQRTAKHEMGLDGGDAAKIDEVAVYEFIEAKTATGKEIPLPFEIKLGKTDPRTEAMNAAAERAMLVRLSEKIGDFVGERVSKRSQTVAADKVALLVGKIQSAEIESKTRPTGKDKITIEGLSSCDVLKFSVVQRPDGSYLTLSKVETVSVAGSKNKKQPGA